MNRDAREIGAKMLYRFCLQPFVDGKKAQPEFADSLQDQADLTLRYFAGQADTK